MVKIYEYNKCSTCQKALKFLKAREIEFKAVPIVDQPPTTTELKKMLGYLKAEGGSFKNLFNTSGVQYRELGIAEKIKNGLSEEAAFKLLSENGKLVKRPFVLTETSGLVGFKEDQWKLVFKK